MEKYGSDKPDLRFGLEIRNISGQVSSCGFSVFSAAVANGGSVRGINGKGLADKLSRKDIDALGETVKTYSAKGLAWMAVTGEGVRGSFVKFLTQEETASIISECRAPFICNTLSAESLISVKAVIPISSRFARALPITLKVR